MFDLKFFLFYFNLTLVFVFKSVTKLFSKLCLKKGVSVEKFYFEQEPISIYLLEKRMFLFLFPLDSAIPLLKSR